MPQRQDIVDRAWDCKEVDWDEYESHRPPYSESLYDLLFQHHEANGGQWNVALDAGAGGGTITRVLLQKFRHVIFSDPSEEYMTRAQKRFHEEAAVGTASFLQRKFAEFKPEQDLPNGTPVDMITAGTCIHFGEPAKIMSQLGPLLRSGGTVAAFSYGSIPILSANDPADPIVRRCKEKILRWIHENIAPLDKSEATGTGQVRYHNVEFDPATWKNVRRITSLPKEPIWPDWVEPAISRVRDTDSIETVHDDFIVREVGYDFFPTYFHNFAPQLPILDQIQEELEELKVAVADRKITARWPVIMVLATKQ